eukprot:snap_masked-scaffold_6-processed-gene-14.17-mRNA-1 protein AED:1.00 eAED:1.00 QI:0/0/0/0/1/1/2/0/713
MTYLLSKEVYIHSDAIRSLHILPGQKLLSGSSDKVLALTDCSQNPPKLLSHDSSHSNVISDICMLNEDTFATSCFDNYIRIYNIKADNSLSTPKTFYADIKQISSLSKFGDDKLLSGSWNGTAKIWQIEQENDSLTIKEIQGVFGLENNISVLGLDASIFVVGSTGERGDNKIRTKLKKIHLIKTIEDHRLSIRGLCKNDNMFFSCGNDGKIFGYCFDGTKLKEFGEEFYGFCYSISYYEGKVYGSYDDLCCRVYDVETGDVEVVQYPSSIWRTAADGDRIYIAGSDPALRIFTRNPFEAADQALTQAFNANIKAQIKKIEENQNKQSQEVERNGKINGEIFDYVFKIEVTSEQNPAEVKNLRLGYNVGSNPFVVAQDFCGKNGLPMDNVEAIVQFINTHVTQTEVPKIKLPEKFFPLSSSSGFFFGAKSDVLNKSLQGALIALKKNSDELYISHKAKCLSDEEFCKINAVAETLIETTSYHGSKISLTDLAPIQKILLSWEIEHLNPVCQFIRFVLLHPDAASNLRRSRRLNLWIDRVCEVLETTVKYNAILTASWVLSNAFRFVDSIPDVLTGRVKIVRALKHLVLKLDPENVEAGSLDENAKESLKHKAIIAGTTVALNLANAVSHNVNDGLADEDIASLSEFLETVVMNFEDPQIRRRAALAYGCLLSRNLIDSNLRGRISQIGDKLKQGIEADGDAEIVQEFMSLWSL